MSYNPSNTAANDHVGPLRPICSCLLCQGKARRFQESDFDGMKLKDPDDGRVHTVRAALGPLPGNDPSENDRADYFWILTLEDGSTRRFWEDRKVVLL